MNNINAIILAAGKGTRMKSNHPKVLHKLFDKSMIQCASDNLFNAGISNQIIVVGYKSEEVIAHLGDKVKYALQLEQLGTGHAVMQAESVIDDFDGYTVVTVGDAPLLTSETIKSTIDCHINNNFACTVITFEEDETTKYGRIIRGDDGNVLKIVEYKDATDEQRKVREMNSGIYCFTTKLLFNALKKVNNNNAQKEYYLTDTLEILKNDGHKIGAIKAKDNDDVLAINSRVELAALTKIMQKRIINMHMENGVTVINPESVLISSDAQIGIDTIIYPGAIIEGKTVIGEGCIIGPNTKISESIIGDNCNIQYSLIENSQINNSNIGPFEKVIDNRRG